MGKKKKQVTRTEAKTTTVQMIEAEPTTEIYTNVNVKSPDITVAPNISLPDITVKPADVKIAPPNITVEIHEKNGKVTDYLPLALGLIGLAIIMK